MGTPVFNYFKKTANQETKGQAFYFKDGTYAFKSEISYGPKDSDRTTIVKTLIITKETKDNEPEKVDKNVYIGSEKYDEILTSHNINLSAARSCYTLATFNLTSSKRNYKVVNIGDIPEKQYRKKLNRLSSKMNYNEIVNKDIREMHELATAFYNLSSKLENSSQKENQIVSNRLGFINIKKLIKKNFDKNSDLLNK